MKTEWKEIHGRGVQVQSGDVESRCLVCGNVILPQENYLARYSGEAQFICAKCADME